MPRAASARKAQARTGEAILAMDKSGFCAWPAMNGDSHTLCRTKCNCECHEEATK